MDLITTSEAIKEFAETLGTPPFLAIDTEFVRTRTYYPQFCVLQIAYQDKIAAIDMQVEGLDLSPIHKLFNNHKIVKVFHSGKQDMEMIFQNWGKLPHPIFDTQIAAMVCGMGQDVSYAGLVYEMLGHSLDKSQQFTNWAERPLTEAQIDYALQDVIHLQEVYLQLQEEIERQKRADWMKEALEMLTDPRQYEVDENALWQKFYKPHHDLALMGRIRALVLWREEQARKQNKLRHFIFRDEKLFAIAQQNPKNSRELKKISGISIAMRLKNSLLKALKEAKPIKEKERPLFPVSMLSQIQRHKKDLLRLLLRCNADRFNISEKFVATSDDLLALATGQDPKVNIDHGWRKEVFGADARRLLAGKIALTIEGDEVVIKGSE